MSAVPGREQQRILLRPNMFSEVVGHHLQQVRGDGDIPRPLLALGRADDPLSVDDTRRPPYPHHSCPQINVCAT